MELTDYCTEITERKSELKESDDTLGLRIMCPEYSGDYIDVKTFPLPKKEGSFILCWNLKKEGTLYAAIKPYQPSFCYRCKYAPGEKTQYHTHDYIELAYIVKGEFKQRIMGNDILFQKGELCLIDKNCPHQDFLGGQDSIIIFLGLANEIFDQVMVENIGEEKLLDFLRTALLKQKDIRQFLHFKPKDTEDNKLNEMFLAVFKELEHHDTATKYICKGYIIRILHHLSTSYEFRLSNEQRKKMNWLIYEEIKRYIEENYESITIKELISKFHYNEDYYNRLLKEKLGMTYLEYVQELRLSNALKLLKSTDMTVEMVANRVGYQNKGYFYKIFLDKYNTTPAKLRKQR